MNKRIRNVLITPIVLLVRAPLMIIFITLMKVGEGAECAADLVGTYVPGWER